MPNVPLAPPLSLQHTNTLSATDSGSIHPAFAAMLNSATVNLAHDACPSTQLLAQNMFSSNAPTHARLFKKPTAINTASDNLAPLTLQTPSTLPNPPSPDMPMTQQSDFARPWKATLDCLDRFSTAYNHYTDTVSDTPGTAEHTLGPSLPLASPPTTESRTQTHHTILALLEELQVLTIRLLQLVSQPTHSNAPPCSSHDPFTHLTQSQTASRLQQISSWKPCYYSPNDSISSAESQKFDYNTDTHLATPGPLLRPSPHTSDLLSKTCTL